MKTKILRIALLCLTVAWICFIFSNSMDSGAESGEKSSAVTEIVNKIADSLGITADIPESFVRNMAHFGEFLILSLLICGNLALTSLVRSRAVPFRCVLLLSAAPICTLVASIDELIQTFSAGRAAQLSDIITDSLGAVCGVCAFILVYIVVKHVFMRKNKV